MTQKISLFALFFFLFQGELLSENSYQRREIMVDKAEKAINGTDMRSEMEFLCSNLCEGRASFTRGGSETAFHYVNAFSRRGLVPIGIGGNFSSSLEVDGKVFHNVIGLIPSTLPSDTPSYIFVIAHYDGIGVLDGQLYPGADSNASGLVSMLAIMDGFRHLTSHGLALEANLVFAAIDGKQHSLGGARALWDALERCLIVDPYRGEPVQGKDIVMLANLDILGGTQAPIYGNRRDYLLMIGGRSEDNAILGLENLSKGFGMDLAYDYYGSESFTDLFLKRISDQKPFLENKVPCVMFTSGISMNTNKIGDDISIIDFEILEKRTKLIYHWLYRICRNSPNTKKKQ